MNQYKEQKTHWRETKALEFFRNFIRNHDGLVNDNDTFELVSGLKTAEQWIKAVKDAFPVRVIQKMQEGYRRDRLDFDDEPKEMIREIWCSQTGRKKMRLLLTNTVNGELEKHPLEQYEDEIFPKKVKELQSTLKLSDFEINILLVFAFMRNEILCIADGHGHRSDENDKAVFIAKSLDCDVSDVMGALNETKNLRRYRCIDDEFDFNGALFNFLNGISSEPLANIFFIKSKDEVLPWEFYGALTEKHGKLLERILSSCDGTKSANILLYGAPGTGKSSFAKTLAARMKRECYMVKQNPGESGRRYSNPEFRFAALQVCAEQVDVAQSLIVIDEADEMLRGGAGGSLLAALFGNKISVGDKGLLNSVLDSVKVPTIWITNTPAAALDESSRRRFDYSVRFDPLTDSQRKMIWQNNVTKMNLNHLVTDEMQTKFSSVYPVSAGGITLVLQNLVKLSPDASEVEELVGKLMKPHCELLGLTTAMNKMLPAKDYSLSGLNIKGKIGLENIVEAVRNFQSGCGTDELDRPRMNLLFSGPPGTGKTEFVKYLGTVLNTKVIVKMGSDLLNMYVGGTEQNVRQAFAEAEQEHAILFLDEIDGLLQSRDHAQRSWEVTQVNELLHQMENFNGIMIGATNFAANLDPAVMRRFTFKLEFDYLDDAGKKIFFERMFKSPLTAEEERRLAAIPRLAPGDFRTVRQSFFYLGKSVGHDALLDSLEQESFAKTSLRCTEKRKMGFS